MSVRQSKFLQWINYRVKVTLSETRNLVGSFIAFDKHMNVVLSDTEEFLKLKSKEKGKPDKDVKRSLGLVLVRGDSIISFSAESSPSQSNKRNESIKQTANTVGTATSIGRGSLQAPIGLSGPGLGVGTGADGMYPVGRGKVMPNN